MNAPSKQKSKRVKKNDESKNDIEEDSDYEGSTDESIQKEEEESDRDAPDEEQITGIRECNQDAVISKSDCKGGVTRSIEVIFNFLGDNPCQVKLNFFFFYLLLALLRSPDSKLS